MLTGRRFAETVVTSCRCRTMRPSSGTSKPAIIRSVVVLPQPLGPSSEKNSPSRDRERDPAHGAGLPEALADALEGDGDVPVFPWHGAGV